MRLLIQFGDEIVLTNGNGCIKLKDKYTNCITIFNTNLYFVLVGRTLVCIIRSCQMLAQLIFAIHSKSPSVKQLNSVMNKFIDSFGSNPLSFKDVNEMRMNAVALAGAMEWIFHFSLIHFISNN